MDCEGFHTQCKQCGKRFPGRTKENPCPDCGKDRKCENSAVHGYKWCTVHGGPNPSKGFYGLGRGLETGMSSSFPLTQLAAKKNAMAKSGSILSNRKSIEVIRGRIEELLERIKKNEAADRLGNLQKKWKVFIKVYNKQGKEIETGIAVRKLEEEFDALYHDYKSWEQLKDYLDLDRKMIESEVKIAKDLQAILTADDAYDMLADFFAIIIRLETDPQKLKAYKHEFARLIGEGPIAEAGASGRETITF